MAAIIIIENVTSAMHCNLWPSDATPILIPFNYDAIIDVSCQERVAMTTHSCAASDCVLLLQKLPESRLQDHNHCVEMYPELSIVYCPGM